MPQPTSSDVLVSLPLTNLSIAYIQDNADAFVADQVFPNVPVERQGGLYLTYERDDWLRDEAEERAPGTPSAGGGYQIDWNGQYFCHVYAFHKDIDDQTRSNAKGFMDMDRDATEFVTRKLLIKRDVIWGARYFQSGIWTNDWQGQATQTGVSGQFQKWSQGGSTPVEDITNGILAVAELTGYRPNFIVMTPDVFAVLKSNADVLDRIRYTQRGLVTTDILSSLFEVPKILVPYGIKNTAVEGMDTVTGSSRFQWILGTKKLLLGYAAPSPGLLQPSAGYTFSWSDYLGAGVQGNVISAFRMPELKSDRVEGEMAFDCRVVAPDLAVMFNNAI
jgi:hypothetical protein